MILKSHFFPILLIIINLKTILSKLNTKSYKKYYEILVIVSDFLKRHFLNTEFFKRDNLAEDSYA